MEVNSVTMTLSDWFTIVTIFLAISTFFSQSERGVILLKIPNRLFKISLFLMFLGVPFLLYFDKICKVPILTFLNSFPFRIDNPYLPLPSDWAFIITFITFSYWIYWFRFKLKKVKPTIELVDEYLKGMEILPFEDLFRLFIKYESAQVMDESNFNQYSKLIANKLFFRRAIAHNPLLYLAIIEKADIKIVLASKLPEVIKEYIISQINKQRQLGAVSIYNQETYNENELIIFDLVNAYFKIWDKCLEKNVFEGHNFKMINSFLQTIQMEIIRCIKISEDSNICSDYPSANHKLISNILEFFSDKLEDSTINNEFLRDYFTKQYSKSIITILNENESKIPECFLKIQFNSFLNIYFNNIKVDKRMSEVEYELTKNKNNYYKIRFKTCWEYSDNEIFGGEQCVLEHEKSKRERFIKQVVVPILDQ